MARIGFFEMLVDDSISWNERNAINSAHDRADAALVQGEMLGASLGAFQARLAAQQREIVLLRTVVGVLATVLRDTGVIDPKVLDYRLEAALEQVEEDSAPRAATVVCLRCSQSVPSSRTVVTEVGTLCDRCHASG